MSKNTVILAIDKDAWAFLQDILFTISNADDGEDMCKKIKIEAALETVTDITGETNHLVDAYDNRGDANGEDTTSLKILIGRDLSVEPDTRGDDCGDNKHRLVSAKDLREGDHVDLEGDPHVDSFRECNDLAFHYAKVVSVQREAGDVIHVRFERIGAAGFPSSHQVKVRVNQASTRTSSWLLVSSSSVA